MTKITRQTQKIFANAASNNGVIGSGQDGTKVLTNNLATLQSKGAWDTGWLDMVLGTKKFPPLEEFQALDFINTYQLSYLFQEGVPEYDSGTTYFTNSWVKKAGTNKLYGSLTDTNVGNALTDATKWKLLVDFDATVTADTVLNYAADTGGGVNHYLIAPSPAMPAYAAGIVVWLKPLHANSGACDIGVNGGALKSIKLMDGADPAIGNILTTGFYCLAYDGTNFVLLNPSLGSAAYYNVGTTAGTIPVLTTGGKYPALDGSLITNLPPQFTATDGTYSSLVVLGDITIQTGYSPVTAGANPTITFPVQFSAAPVVQLTGMRYGAGVWLNGLPTAASFGTKTGDSDEQGGASADAFMWTAIGKT